MTSYTFLAHGLEAASQKAFGRLESAAKEFAKEICKPARLDWEELMREHLFVKMWLSKGLVLDKSSS